VVRLLLVQIILGRVYAFSVFIKPFENEFGIAAGTNDCPGLLSNTQTFWYYRDLQTFRNERCSSNK